MRDNAGRFIKGRVESPEEKLKRLEAVKKAGKDSPRYIDSLVQENPYIHNSWRSFMFTLKGKKVGVCDEWRQFKTFYADMSPTYIKGHRLIRVDKQKPFSKENCLWVSDEHKSIFLDTTVKIEYDGLYLSIKEWAERIGVAKTAIKQRYRAHLKKGNYTNEEIIWGKKVVQARHKQDFSELTDTQKIRDKASKMISSYRNTDKKRGRECNLTIDWFIDNIFGKTCTYCGESKNVGCDRVLNDIGHMTDNVVSCCYDCNVARQDNFTHEEMIVLGETIRKIKEKRVWQNQEN